MPFSFERNTADERIEDRISVRILATLAWYGEAQGVVIDNLSSRGALLSGSELPGSGTEVVLMVADREIVATVAWCNEPNCGLSFHRAIDAHQVRDAARRQRVPKRHRTLSDWITIGAG